MKEILFRGKERGTNNWVYGSLILAKDYCYILQREEDVHPMDWPYLDEFGTFDGKATPVIPETVGQLLEYPGYYEFNRAEIFEGDILETYCLKADYENNTKLAQAQSKIEIAKAEAEALKIKAQAEADANEIIEKSITDKIIDKTIVDKWNGELPSVVGGSNGVMMPSDVLG